MSFDEIWSTLMSFDESWSTLTPFDEIRSTLTSVGEICSALLSFREASSPNTAQMSSNQTILFEVFGVFWCTLVSFGDVVWQTLMALSEIWSSSIDWIKVFDRLWWLMGLHQFWWHFVRFDKSRCPLMRFDQLCCHWLRFDNFNVIWWDSINVGVIWWGLFNVAAISWDSINFRLMTPDELFAWHRTPPIHCHYRTSRLLDLDNAQCANCSARQTRNRSD